MLPPHRSATQRGATPPRHSSLRREPSQESRSTGPASPGSSWLYTSRADGFQVWKAPRPCPDGTSVVLFRIRKNPKARVGARCIPCVVTGNYRAMEQNKAPVNITGAYPARHHLCDVGAALAARIEVRPGYPHEVRWYKVPHCPYEPSGEEEPLKVEEIPADSVHLTPAVSVCDAELQVQISYVTQQWRAAEQRAARAKFHCESLRRAISEGRRSAGSGHDSQEDQSPVPPHPRTPVHRDLSPAVSLRREEELMDWERRLEEDRRRQEAERDSLRQEAELLQRRESEITLRRVHTSRSQQREADSAQAAADALREKWQKEKKELLRQKEEEIAQVIARKRQTDESLRQSKRQLAERDRELDELREALHRLQEAERRRETERLEPQAPWQLAAQERLVRNEQRRALCSDEGAARNCIRADEGNSRAVSLSHFALCVARSASQLLTSERRSAAVQRRLAAEAAERAEREAERREQLAEQLQRELALGAARSEENRKLERQLQDMSSNLRVKQDRLVAARTESELAKLQAEVRGENAALAAPQRNPSPVSRPERPRSMAAAAPRAPARPTSRVADAGETEAVAHAVTRSQYVPVLHAAVSAAPRGDVTAEVLSGQRGAAAPAAPPPGLAPAAPSPRPGGPRPAEPPPLDSPSVPPPRVSSSSPTADAYFASPLELPPQAVVPGLQVYTAAELRGWRKDQLKQRNIDPCRMERHLSTAEFEELFGLKYEEFVKFPAWKQDFRKQRVGLDFETR
eukprot:TRINITY_DN8428_c1_g1_i1.p1 TRINITY_DN8428_c1_g1~~TRINITY_DN8428_c1_g1_i1.p1  ORF type:complete len:804 (+),score=200.88 TRINITY_DN8428_c1_g1_i1:167-2413(+)